MPSYKTAPTATPHTRAKQALFHNSDVFHLVKKWHYSTPSQQQRPAHWWFPFLLLNGTHLLVTSTSSFCAATAAASDFSARIISIKRSRSLSSKALSPETVQKRRSSTHQWAGTVDAQKSAKRMGQGKPSSFAPPDALVHNRPSRIQKTEITINNYLGSTRQRSTQI